MRTTTQWRAVRRLGTVLAGLLVALPAAGAVGVAVAGATTPSLVVTSPSPLPEGTVGQPYGPVTLTAANGTAPYSWTVLSGAMPPGLGLSATGTITGTPTTAGETWVVFGVTDSASPADTAAAQLLIEVQNTTATTLTTPSLPGGTVGGVYRATLTATGGVPPYYFEAVRGSLPRGVTLNGVSGNLTGIPTTAGPWVVEFCVEDSTQPNAQLSCQTYSGTVTPRLALSLTPALPVGTVGVPYTGMVTATGGTQPYIFTVTGGALPPGLTLNPATGQLTGTPTTPGTFTVTITVTDASTPTEQASGTFTITIKPAPLTIITGIVAGNALPNGTVGVPYTALLQATGGTIPYTWSAIGGTLPPGLVVNPNGSITGTPTMAGTFGFIVRVTDTSSPTMSAEAGESITIIGTGPIITTTSVPNAIEGELYATALNVVGGTPPYMWAITGGTLPAGLALGVANGVEVITGTPTVPGTYTFTVQVTDSSSPSRSDSVVLTLTVLPAGLVVTTDTALGTNLPVGVVGTPYSATLTAAGGTAPYSWSIAAGSLPAGLTLNPSTGVISGTPTTAAPYSFTAKVTDSGSPAQTATSPLGIVIFPAGTTPTNTTTTPQPPPLTVITGTAGNLLPGGTTGVAYASAFNASGGTPPYSWTVTSGTLPAGLSLSPAGIIAGTPTTAGTTTFTVTVKDSESTPAAVSQTETITVAP